MYPTYSDDEATVLDFQPHWSRRSEALLDTECVAPLPFAELRPDWQIWLGAKWARYAVPICGVIAGLALVVSYLALGGERRSVAAIANPSPIVMTVDSPIPSAVVVAQVVDAPVVSEEIEMEEAPMREAPKAKKSAKKRGVQGKRGPIKLNTQTALGDLRVSR